MTGRTTQAAFSCARPGVLGLALLAHAAAAESTFETVVGASPELDDAQTQAKSNVSKEDLERRLPRSAPDALRYEPGVFVQQTAHGQGSAFLRGLTGQQTVLLFDGIRLNNATWRQGPNQYFFTLDARALDAIEVQRGGASTRWGSDALGGVLHARPLEPGAAGDGSRLGARLLARGTTADAEWGGRAQLDAATRWGAVDVAFLGGVGARRVGLLQGPAVLNPNPATSAGPLPWVPRYAEYDPTRPLDGQLPALRTQLGTGFDEVAGDGRLVLRLERLKVTAAAYVYRQTNAPRTDQCPPPAAPSSECFTYEEQYRHLASLSLEGRPSFLDEARAVLSWQQQRERRRLDLTAANQVARGVDVVNTLGLAAVGARQLGALHLRVGLDQYVDLVGSAAQHAYTDTGDVVVDSRGQYLDGSAYGTGGAWAEGVLKPLERVSLRGGVRLAWNAASAPADPASGSAAVARAWVPLVGHVGVDVRPVRPLTLFLDLDRSYRAPNLNDLTARQQTGPGFQFENPALRPEVAYSAELGARVRLPWLQADAWVFQTLLDGAVLKVSQPLSACPPDAPECRGSWSRLKLENAPALSQLRGAEAAARVTVPGNLQLRSTISYTWSDGPRVGVPGYEAPDAVGERVPLSRTPPLNGTAELDWSPWKGVHVGAALQWAASQDRLALADYTDGRLPKYGTPAFAVVHLRASARLFDDRVFASLILENVFDTPWRFHGSSVNGPGRGLLLQLELGHLFRFVPRPKG